MDELQATFTNKLFIWGISSHSEELFTPIERLETSVKELFLPQKINKKKINIEIPVVGNDIVVPSSMKLFYNQFNIKNTKTKNFCVQGIELDEKSIIYNYLFQEKKLYLIVDR